MLNLFLRLKLVSPNYELDDSFQLELAKLLTPEWFLRIVQSAVSVFLITRPSYQQSGQISEKVKFKYISRYWVFNLIENFVFGQKPKNTTKSYRKLMSF